MTLFVFLGVVVGLLILRLLPGLLLRLVLAIPRHRLMAIMRWTRDRKIGIVLWRKRRATLDGALARSHRSTLGHRVKVVVVSTSLLFLAVLVTTAFWSFHSTALMILLR